MLARVALGGALDEFQEFAKALSLGGFHLRKSDADTERRIALGDNAGKDDAFHPNLSISHPQTHLYWHAVGNGSGGFYK